MSRMVSLGVLVLVVGISLGWGRNVSLDVYGSFLSLRTRSNDRLMQREVWRYEGEAALRVQASPAFIYEEGFQADALVDIYLSQSYRTNVFVTSIKEMWVDMLFWERLAFRGGFLKLDYGAAGRFRILDPVEYSPVLRDMAQRIMIGTETHGYRGFPAWRARVSLPEWAGWRVAFEQGMVWADFADMRSNYFLSALNVSYGNWGSTWLVGYEGNSFGTDAYRHRPVWGGYMFLRLPWDGMLWAEALYKRESYRPFVSNNVLHERRKDRDFFNLWVRGQQIFEEPWLGNAIGLEAEYLWYGEGLTTAEYDAVYDFLKDPANMAMHGGRLLVLNRTFQHAGEGRIWYRLVHHSLQFGYAFGGVSGGVFWHRLDISKTYESAVISLGLTHHHAENERMRLLYGDNDWQIGCMVQVSL